MEVKKFTILISNRLCCFDVGGNVCQPGSFVWNKNSPNEYGVLIIAGTNHTFGKFSTVLLFV